MHEDERSRSGPWFLDPTKLAFLGFLGIAGYFLIAEHWAHIVPWLPWLFVLACPLLHFLTHRGHGGHGGHGPGRTADSRTAPKSQGAVAADRDAPGKEQAPGGNRT